MSIYSLYRLAYNFRDRFALFALSVIVIFSVWNILYRQTELADDFTDKAIDWLQDFRAEQAETV